MDGRRRVDQGLHDPPRLLDAVLALEPRAVALHRGVQQHLVGRGPSSPSVPKSMSRLIGSGSRRLAALGLKRQPYTGGGVELDDELVGLAAGVPRRAKPRRGGRLKTSRTSVWVTGRCLPVRMKNGTPDQRQFSISSRIAAYVSVVESGRDAVDVPVAVVLAADVVRRVSRRHRMEDGEQGVLERVGIARRRDLHRRRADDLHEMVDDHVAQRPDRVVEVPAVLDAEALGHRDLDTLDVVAVPDRLQDRVREAQVQDLLRPIFPRKWSIR